MGKENLPFRGAHGSLSSRLLDAAEEGMVIVNSILTLLLILLVQALAFMLWVVWGLEKQIRQDRRHRDAITRPKG